MRDGAKEVKTRDKIKAKQEGYQRDQLLVYDLQKISIDQVELWRERLRNLRERQIDRWIDR